jgi:streptogramin lyase
VNRTTQPLLSITIITALAGWLIGPQTRVITIVSGDGQVAVPGETLVDPIVAQITDADGNPLPGVRVVVTVEGDGVFLVPDHAQTTIETIAGGGTDSSEGIPATDALLVEPIDTAVDADGNVYVADPSAGLIRKIDAATGVISTVAGGGFGPFSADGQCAVEVGGLVPRSVEIGKAVAGNLVFVDEASARVFRLDLGANLLFLAAGGGTSTDEGIPATEAKLPEPLDVSEDYNGNLYIATDRGTIRRVGAQDGAVTTVVTADQVPGGLEIEALEVHRDGRRLAIAESGGYLLVDPSTLETTRFSVGAASGVSVDVSGSQFFSLSGPHQVKVLEDAAEPPDAGLVVAGNGTQGFSGDGGSATAAALDDPRGPSVNPEGNLLIADRGNARVRRVTFARKEVTEVVLYSDAQGLLRSYPVKVLSVNSPGPSVKFTDPVSGASATAGTQTIGAGGGAPQRPDPNQGSRQATNIEALKFPRWTAMAGVRTGRKESLERPFLLDARISVDSRNIVHTITKTRVPPSDVIVTETIRLDYSTNRWETRNAGGFSTFFPIRQQLDIGNFDLAVPPLPTGDDEVHVVWEESVPVETPSGIFFANSLFHRYLVQEPSGARWTDPVAIAPAMGGDVVVGYSLAELAADPDGGLHLAATEVTTVVAAPEQKTRVLYRFAQTPFSGWSSPKVLASAEASSSEGGLKVFALAAAGGPMNEPHVVWGRQFVGVEPEDPSVLGIFYDGPSGSTKMPGQILDLDMAADSDNTAHFARGCPTVR